MTAGIFGEDAGGSTSMGVSAIVPAYRRMDQTITTVRRLQECVPPPQEILVQFDGNEAANAATLQTIFPNIKVTTSEESIGPGGARNAMIERASHEIVASFDDDSYPIDADYFRRLVELFRKYPSAAVIASQIFHIGEDVVEGKQECSWVADFCGCGAAYRRSCFLINGGYVPLVVAYGMEEVDVALRLHAEKAQVLSAKSLRVYHDTNLARHSDPRVTAMSLANIALLIFLRYPLGLWPYGAAQLLNRLQWLLRNGRSAGVLRGLFLIPRHLWQHRQYRDVVPAAAVRSYLSLRRHPKPA